jgi:ribosomal protein S18 acetylase RimI-like enzyme
MAVEPARFSATSAPFGLALRRAGSSDVDAVVTVDTGAFGSGVAAARAWLEPLCRSDEAVIAVGELNGVPVATGYALQCDGEAGPSVYLGGIGVLPAARRRGVAAALSTWLLARGFAEGARFGHLQTDSDSAARVYARLGFEEFNGIDVYLER